MLLQIHKFFLTRFHHGTINLLLHAVGITLFVISFIQKNLPLMILSIVVMESGHIYEYYQSDTATRKKFIQSLPFQLALIIGLIVVLKLLGWF